MQRRPTNLAVMFQRRWRQQTWIEQHSFKPFFVQIFDANFTVENLTHYVKKNMKIKHYRSQILQINSREVGLGRSRADCNPIVPSSGRQRYSKRVHSPSLYKETRSNLKAHL